MKKAIILTLFFFYPSQVMQMIPRFGKEFHSFFIPWSLYNLKLIKFLKENKGFQDR